VRPIAWATDGLITGVGVQTLAVGTEGLLTLAIIPISPSVTRRSAGGVFRPKRPHSLRDDEVITEEIDMLEMLRAEDEEMLAIIMSFMEVRK